jgi:hypothetical protein
MILFFAVTALLCVLIPPGVMSHSAVVLGASGATGKVCSFIHSIYFIYFLRSLLSLSFTYDSTIFISQLHFIVTYLFNHLIILKALVKELLINPKWTKVTTIGRSPLDLTGHANLDKLNQVTVSIVLSVLRVDAWCVLRAAWCVVCGAWCVVRGAWCVVRGAWCVVRGAWCGVTCVCGGGCVWGPLWLETY